MKNDLQDEPPDSSQSSCFALYMTLHGIVLCPNYCWWLQIRFVPLDTFCSCHDKPICAYSDKDYYPEFHVAGTVEKVLQEILRVDT